MRNILLPLLCGALSGCIMLQGPPIQSSANAGTVPVVPLQLTTATGVRCNAVRLNTTTVATAAHCVADQAAVTLTEMGQNRLASSVVIHPAYELTPRTLAAGVDLARIAAPPPFAQVGRVPIRPIQPGPVEIQVVSVGGGYTSIPCGYLGRSGAIVELSCQVSLGWSGAPVVQGGALVGILSARGQAQSAGIAQMADATLLDFF